MKWKYGKKFLFSHEVAKVISARYPSNKLQFQSFETLLRIYFGDAQSTDMFLFIHSFTINLRIKPENLERIPVFFVASKYV